MRSPREEELRGYQDQVWRLLAAHMDTVSTGALDVPGDDPVQVALAELALDQVRSEVRGRVSLSSMLATLEERKKS